MRVAILGGGMAGLSAAWRLSEPDSGASEVTVYQRGWRLGGKGASSGGSTDGSRSTACTCGSATTTTRSVFCGTCTASSTGPVRIPAAPSARWEDGFFPASLIGLGSEEAGGWADWLAWFPENDQLPGRALRRRRRDGRRRSGPAGARPAGSVRRVARRPGGRDAPRGALGLLGATRSRPRPRGPGRRDRHGPPFDREGRDRRRTEPRASSSCSPPCSAAWSSMACWSAGSGPSTTSTFATGSDSTGHQRRRSPPRSSAAPTT